MTYPDYLWIILGMGAVTYLPRMLPLVALADRKLPQWALDWLGLIPVAILAALVAPSLVVDSAGRHLDFSRPELFAAIPTLALALRTRSLGVAVVLGMACYWLAGKWL